MVEGLLQSDSLLGVDPQHSLDQVSPHWVFVLEHRQISIPLLLEVLEQIFLGIRPEIFEVLQMEPDRRCDVVPLHLVGLPRQQRFL